MSDRDAVSLLVDQHRQIADLFRRTLDSNGARRRRNFVRLRKLISVHETAEEMLIHPRLRWVDQEGDILARARTEEEEQLKTALADLDKLDGDDPEFTRRLEALRALVLAHNGAEETDEFPVLHRALDAKQRRRLRRRIATVEKIAPTRPHPGLTLGGENVLGGGLAMVVDRTRDGLAGLVGLVHRAPG